MFSPIAVKLQGYQQGICYWRVRCVWGKGNTHLMLLLDITVAAMDTLVTRIGLQIWFQPQLLDFAQKA